MRLLLPAPRTTPKNNTFLPKVCGLAFAILFCVTAWSIFSLYYSFVENLPVPHPLSTTFDRLNAFKEGSKYFSGTLKDPTSLYSKTQDPPDVALNDSQDAKDEETSSTLKIPNAYAYSTLSKEDQANYEIILDALQNCKKRAYPIADKEEIERINACVEADYPLLEDFVSLVVLEGDMLGASYVAGVPLVSDSQRDETMAAIEKVRDSWLAALPTEGDDYRKALYAYDWIIENCEYDSLVADSDKDIVIKAKGRDKFTLGNGSSLPTEHGQTVSNVLLDKKAVCAGYAKTFQYLMQSVGIPCTYVSGTAEGESHAWNLVFLDGNYYFVDSTWGELDYGKNAASSYPPGTKRYWYFAVDSASMAETHSPEDYFTLPVCTALDDNYYVREQLYFSIPSPQYLGTLMSQELPKNSLVTIRCANAEIYDALYDSWVVNGAIGRFSNQEGYRYFGVKNGLNIIEILPY